MAINSVTKEIFDTFIDALKEQNLIDEEFRTSLQKMLNTGSISKDKIVSLLKGEGKDENSGT